MTITDAALFDALEQRNPWRADLSGLQQASRELERRYQSSTFLAKDETGAWMTAGGVGVAALGVGVGAASALGSAIGSMLGGGAGGSAAAGGAAAASTLLFAGGIVLAGAGVVRLANNAEVRGEIRRRQTALPATLSRSQDIRAVLFFPVTPLPRSVEISYTAGQARHRLYIDTQQALAKAHAVAGK